MKLLGMQTVPGQALDCALPVPGYQPLEAVLLCGEQPGKTLVVTAGVHGCEYIGILAAQRLRRALDLHRLRGQIILLPLLNPGGFYGAMRQVMPEDGKNLNREFPGRMDGTYAQRVAAVIEREVYPAADFLIDLHGGDWQEALTPLVFFPCAAGDRIAQATRRQRMRFPCRCVSDRLQRMVCTAGRRKPAFRRCCLSAAAVRCGQRAK